MAPWWSRLIASATLTVILIITFYLHNHQGCVLLWGVYRSAKGLYAYLLICLSSFNIIPKRIFFNKIRVYKHSFASITKPYPGKSKKYRFRMRAYIVVSLALVGFYRAPPTPIPPPPSTQEVIQLQFIPLHFLFFHCHNFIKTSLRELVGRELWAAISPRLSFLRRVVIYSWVFYRSNRIGSRSSESVLRYATPVVESYRIALWLPLTMICVWKTLLENYHYNQECYLSRTIRLMKIIIRSVPKSKSDET